MTSRPFNLWHFVWVAVVFSVLLSVLANIALHGRLLWQYPFSAMFIASLVAAPLIYLIKRLHSHEQALITQHAYEANERRNTLVALQESQVLFSSAFHDAPIAMALGKLNGEWVMVNSALCTLVGYTEKDLLALTFKDITHPDDLDADLAFFRQLLDGTIRTYQMEKRYLHKQGHVVWILLSVSMVRDSTGQPLYLIAQMQDIIERKKAEEALIDSEQQLRLALEDRERLSQDLHDHVIQSIYAIGMALESCLLLEKDRHASGLKLENAISDLNGVIIQLRDYIERGSRNSIKGSELAEALEEFVRTIPHGDTFGVHVIIEPSTRKDITDHIATHILHIVREAVTNTLRHAKAHTANVSLRRTSEGLHLDVRDDGIGFIPEQRYGYGRGLLNIAARAKKLDAKFQVISEPGSGTRIIVDIPGIEHALT